MIKLHWWSNLNVGESWVICQQLVIHRSRLHKHNHPLLVDEPLYQLDNKWNLWNEYFWKMKNSTLKRLFTIHSCLKDRSLPERMEGWRLRLCAFLWPGQSLVTCTKSTAAMLGLGWSWGEYDKIQAELKCFWRPKWPQRICRKTTKLVGSYF